MELQKREIKAEKEKESNKTDIEIQTEYEKVHQLMLMSLESEEIKEFIEWDV